MNIITLLNEKGGVGKTTLATTLSAILASRGYRTLLIDADSQGHATLSVRAKRTDNLYHLLANDAAWQDVLTAIHPDYYGGNPDEPKLWLVASSSGTSQLTNGIEVLRFKTRLIELKDTFDFIVIDTSPSISDLHTSFYLGSKYIIYPTECTYMPMQGLFKSINHLQNARDKLGERGYDVAEMLGIVPTKFNGRESVQHQNFGYLRGKFGDEKVMTPVRRLADWEKASQLRVPIHVYDPRGNAAQDAITFVDEVLERMGLEVTHG